MVSSSGLLFLGLRVVNLKLVLFQCLQLVEGSYPRLSTMFWHFNKVMMMMMMTIFKAFLLTWGFSGPKILKSKFFE